MVKIDLITCFWGRPALSRLFIAYWSRMARDLKEFGIDLVMCGAVSPEDPYINAFPREAESWRFVRTANKPLSIKYQKALSMRRPSADGVLIMGSDDFADGPFVIRAAGLLDEWQAVCPIDIYVWEPPAVKAYYLKPWMVGAGRIIRHDLLGKVDGKLWPEIRNRGLDGLMWRGLEDHIESLYTWSHVQEETLIVDVKTREGNMWSLKKLLSHIPFDRVPVSATVAKAIYPEYYNVMRQLHRVG